MPEYIIIVSLNDFTAGFNYVSLIHHLSNLFTPVLSVEVNKMNFSLIREYSDNGFVIFN